MGSDSSLGPTLATFQDYEATDTHTQTPTLTLHKYLFVLIPQSRRCLFQPDVHHQQRTLAHMDADIFTITAFSYILFICVHEYIMMLTNVSPRGAEHMLAHSLFRERGEARGKMFM